MLLSDAHREAFLGHKEEAQRCLRENAAIEGWRVELLAEQG